eukprot:TRINITY_DN124275_c0_g1_i1.p1 TRINITY_DN124275_c0_g1~~TRINITY_DN124275_c0_g1_i1.p1  ORF type:complete len:348 (-),score=84.80 TRINITY_DN124275_c0_g1_i1:534-1577(-)
MKRGSGRRTQQRSAIVGFAGRSLLAVLASSLCGSATGAEDSLSAVGAAGDFVPAWWRHDWNLTQLKTYMRHSRIWRARLERESEADGPEARLQWLQKPPVEEKKEVKSAQVTVKLLSTQRILAEHDRLVRLAQERQYPKSLEEFPRLVIPAMRLCFDAARAFILVDFLSWGFRYGFLKARKAFLTSLADVELLVLSPHSVVFYPMNVKAETGDLHEPLPYHDVDFALISQTLEHLYNPFLAMQNLLHALAPGGYVFASVPFVNKLHGGLVFGDPLHFSHFTPLGLVTLMLSVGFEVLELGQWGNADYVKEALLGKWWPHLGKLTNFTNDPKLPSQTWVLARKPLEGS